MAVKFTQEQIDSFITTREEKLASFAWDDYKKMFPKRAQEIGATDTDGIAYMTKGVKKAKLYMAGYENDPQFNRWLSGYLELQFHMGENFDEHPFTQKILTEKLWHPYKRVDILMKILAVITADPSQKEFYQKLEEMV